MKRAVIYEPQDLRIEECEIPTILDGEVLIKNRISTTCGTDVKIYKRGYPLLTPPHPFGHEYAGDIVKVGKHVKDFQVGDRVAVHNTAPCNICYYCKRGQPSMCTHLTFNRGTYAQYVKVPEAIVKQNMFKLPPHMSYKAAALMEPLSCAVYGIEQTPIHQGDTLIVNGSGPIGLMFMKLAVLRGAKVIASDLSDYRLAIAKKLGASHTLNMSNIKEPAEAIKRLTDEQRGGDIVIEATGQIPVWETSVQMVRKGGFVLLFGGTKANTFFRLDANRLHYSQLTIKGVFHTTPYCVETAFKLLDMGVIKAEDFIQHEYTLDHLKDAIVEHAKQGVIKNCIVYD